MARIIQRIRTLAITLSCKGSAWATSDLFFCNPYKGEITWRNRCGWWIDGLFSRVFNWAYPGSDEEIEQAFDQPLPHLSERQLAHVWPAFDEMEVTCNDCQWAGSAYDLRFSEGLNLCCPDCGDDSTSLDVHGNMAPWCREVRAKRAGKGAA